MALVGVGSLLLTWPNRVHHSIFSFALAIVITAVCVLWIAGLYANSLGYKAAVNFAQGLAGQTSVALYSVQALALTGPGVSCQRLPDGSFYHYRYEGLRLLYAEPGTYYLLPVNWSSQQGPTYIFANSDQLRIELGGSDLGFGAGGTRCASGSLHISRLTENSSEREGYAKLSLKKYSPIAARNDDLKVLSGRR
jgi:hypothetical protein